MRTVRKTYRAESDDIGDLRTQRPLPNREISHVDPFLFLNHHGPQLYPPGNDGLPFGPHPHRGFETVTFILEGSLTHHDTGGHESVINGGGVQWMTAGRGVEHSELSPPEFLTNGGPLEILQLWVNLPARLKMTEPRYFGLQRNDIPTVADDGEQVRVSVIAGSWNGVTGPVVPLTELTMTTVEMTEGSRINLPVPVEHNVFLYVVRGDVVVSGTKVEEMHLADMNHDDDHIDVVSTSRSFLIFGHGAPHNEPIVAHGPFVMNTEQEIHEAIRDYRAGKFRR